MEQNQNNLLIQQPDSNTPPPLKQDGNELNETPLLTTIQEEEITETTGFRNLGDYWYLPHTDGRTFNQNIKIRNR